MCAALNVAATRQLIERGAISRGDSIVICITDNGYNIIEVLEGHGVTPIRIGRRLADFEASETAPAVAGA